MKIKIPTNLKSTSSDSELFLIIVEGRQPKSYFKARRYFEILPQAYTGTKPKRSFQIGQIVQLTYERYPTLFRIEEILKGASGDTLLVVSFNWDAVENPDDINR